MIERLQYITQDVPGKTHADLCQEACEAGVKWVQLRLKGADESTWLREAEQCSAICKDHGAQLVINDRIDIARRFSADGIHLGKQDEHPKIAREQLGDAHIIGGTCNTIDDALRIHDHVDYLGVGPFRFTSTKSNLSPVLGLNGYKRFIADLSSRGIHTPVIAIGGILLEDVDNLMETGVFGIAVSGLITKAPNKVELIASLREKLNTHVTSNR